MTPTRSAFGASPPGGRHQRPGKAGSAVAPGWSAPFQAPRWLTLYAVVLLVACAHPLNAWDLAAGTPRDQVLARAGQPTRVVAMPGGGQRLQYSMQPMGRFAFMVDLDAAGQVLRSRQVLTAAEFQRIEPGAWSRADVEREFGPPAWIDGVASWNGPVMTYRWMDNDRSDMFYWVYLDPQGIVRRAHPGMEFVNAPNERE